MIKKLVLTLIFINLSIANLSANSLQEAIDSASDGATILLDDGIYPAPININKPIYLKGRTGNAIIKGNGVGSVINISANNVTIENINIMGSGDSHESIDSCIAVKAVNSVKIINNKMSNCLFGVNFEQVNRGQIEGNNISSKDFTLGLKGDGIRLWYSHSNIIRNNHLNNVRDTVFWYSSANRIEENVVENSRYSLHFMYADRNIVLNNKFRNNSVGIFFMYSHGSRVNNNLIQNASGPFGIGIGFKEVSDCIIDSNIIIYNARGLYLDQSPYQPGTTNIYTNNKLYYNTIAIQFHGTNYASNFEENIFKGNMETLSNDTPNSKLALNTWSKNYWDDYEGFDRDKDGFGDTPYQHLVYADKLFNYFPTVRFFYGTPIASLLNFLSKLLPFSDPILLAEDNKPKVKNMDEIK